MKVLIITPACNEEHHLSDLIESMIQQSVLPVEWIIIDDGSTDNTSNLIIKASNKYSWITYLRKEKNGLRSPGKSVMEVFYYGFDKRKKNDYDIYMKIDADLILPNNYLAEIIQQFIQHPTIGICGGICVIKKSYDYTIEQQTNMDHVRGAIKAYRKECFLEIGGLVKKMGWDTIDEHYARYRKWEVCVLSNLHVIHRRSTNQDYGFFRAAYRNGRMLYSIRMGFILLIVNCLKNSIRKPYLLLFFAMFFGYCVSFFNRHEKIVSKDLGAFIRNYRYKKILERIRGYLFI